MCRVLRWPARDFTTGYTRRYRSARSRISGCLGSFVIRTRDGVYGAPRVFGDLREAGETCGKHRVARIMRRHKIKAIRGYKAPRHIAGRPSILAPNRLNREFTVDAPDRAWVTDITYIRTWQGWLYLAVVMDLHARKVVGWSMKPTLARELVLDALLMAVWRRKPQQECPRALRPRLRSTGATTGAASVAPTTWSPA